MHKQIFVFIHSNGLKDCEKLEYLIITKNTLFLLSENGLVNKYLE
jgi:hypothetical protein